MITRLILKLPWFLSTPILVAGAAVIAIGINVIAGPYFQRSFRDDADPLAGLALPAAVAAPRDTPTPPAPEVTSVALATATPVTSAGGPAPPPASTPAAAPSEPIPAAGSAPAAPAPAAGPAVLMQGEFVDGDPGHNGTGRARLIRGADGAVTLRFESFSVTNGPDLFVILSTDPAGSRGSAAAGDALNLGRLKATDGNINYAVPPGTDTTPYRSVIIYCRAFKVVFAIATLETAR